MHYDEHAYLPGEDEEVPDLSKIGGNQVREGREGALKEDRQHIAFLYLVRFHS